MENASNTKSPKEVAQPSLYLGETSEGYPFPNPWRFSSDGRQWRYKKTSLPGAPETFVLEWKKDLPDDKQQPAEDRLSPPPDVQEKS